ncbi:MAG: chromosomal replication initiator protein DnaA [Rectinemataceae bacterium]
MTEQKDIELWNAAMNKAREGLADHEFAMWFKLGFLGIEGSAVKASAPTTFQRDQFLRKYRPYMIECLKAVSGLDFALEIEVQHSGEVMEAPGTESGAVHAADTAMHADSRGYADSQGYANTRGYASPPGYANAQILAKDAAPVRPAPEQSASAPAPRAASRHPLLRPDYRFENYVVGEHNKFAANAAEAVSKNPGRVYNPCLIYGGVGLGKTHLMHAVGNRVFTTRPESRIICITAEEFTNEFIQTIHDRSTQSFKNKYRSVDYLLIDDIHFLQNKPGVQEELFHTFNALYDADKQMVFTCDRPVSELKNLSDRLRSRFERGLNVDLQPPEYETRCAILKSKSASASVPVSDEVIEIIATNVATNVRDLEAALTKLVAYADLVHQEITPEVARKQLKDMFSKFRHDNVTVDSIMRTVAEHYKLTFADLKGKKRSKNIAFPRQVAMYIIRDITEYSTTEIGMEFGGRDHTTVMHSCQKIEERLKLDPNFESTLQGLTRIAKEYGVKS